MELKNIPFIYSEYTCLRVLIIVTLVDAKYQLSEKKNKYRKKSSPNGCENDFFSYILMLVSPLLWEGNILTIMHPKGLMFQVPKWEELGVCGTEKRRSRAGVN